MFRNWIKILRADNNSFIKCFYLMLKTDADNNISYNKNNWAYQIKTMLQDIRLYSQPTLEAYSTHTHSDNLISHSCERITVRFGMHMSHSHSNSTQISSKR